MNANSTAISIAALGVGFNIVLATLAKVFGIPFLFLDTIGTIFSAVLLGPFFGAITGLVTNFITAMLNNPVELPFAIVNMTVGIVVGFVAKKYKFDIKTAIITGLVLSIVAPLIGTPIAVYLFGGLAGSSLDILTGWLVNSGEKIFTAAFLPRIGSNLVDKIGSCIVVALIISRIPNSLMTKIKK